ncbi:energy-coupling factor ABC transporter ATP-binding protein [Azonexus fungiphilus]|uniref:energy-coupling factor ABC transporter ATP-binding protein n=1 Tax=Azonexus fungiphilus TaxID=146940 RepID=UPI0020C4DDAF|nr:ABC transporter ATP-binding protein [Azonexus fungiphilus]
MLEARGLVYRYPDSSRGLEACSLAIAPGSRNALLGANGSGKTTLLQHFNALLRPTGGELHLGGQALTYSRAELKALRCRVGLVFQNPDRQLFSASVEEDVSFGPLNLGLDEATVRERVAAALAATGMTACAARPVHQLSHGQKKRVCIAGVLAMHPEVLLLDEPMAGLDAAMQRELLTLLDDLSGQGISIVVATHDIDFAYAWADRVHLLQAGRCLASFAADEWPAWRQTLLAAGQPLPAVLELQQQLQRLGIVDSAPARSLTELVAALAEKPADFAVDRRKEV